MVKFLHTKFSHLRLFFKIFRSLWRISKFYTKSLVISDIFLNIFRDDQIQNPEFGHLGYFWIFFENFSEIIKFLHKNSATSDIFSKKKLIWSNFFTKLGHLGKFSFFVQNLSNIFSVSIRKYDNDNHSMIIIFMSK